VRSVKRYDSATALSRVQAQVCDLIPANNKVGAGGSVNSFHKTSVCLSTLFSLFPIINLKINQILNHAARYISQRHTYAWPSRGLRDDALRALRDELTSEGMRIALDSH
jgi:hypothetical protein